MHTNSDLKKAKVWPRIQTRPVLTECHRSTTCASTTGYLVLNCEGNKGRKVARKKKSPTPFQIQTHILQIGWPALWNLFKNQCPPINKSEVILSFCNMTFCQVHVFRRTGGHSLHFYAFTRRQRYKGSRPRGRKSQGNTLSWKHSLVPFFFLTMRCCLEDFVVKNWQVRFERQGDMPKT